MSLVSFYCWAGRYCSRCFPDVPAHMSASRLRHHMPHPRSGGKTGSQGRAALHRASRSLALQEQGCMWASLAISPLDLYGYAAVEFHGSCALKGRQTINEENAVNCWAPSGQGRIGASGTERAGKTPNGALG